MLRVADPTEVLPDQFGGVEHNPPAGPALSLLGGLQSTRRGPTVQLINLPSRPLEVKTARDGKSRGEGTARQEVLSLIHI